MREKRPGATPAGKVHSLERSEDTPSQELGANASGKKIESSWDKINRKEINIKASNLATKLFKGMVTPPPGYTTLGYIRPPRLEDVLASLRKFLSEMMMIYVQYFDRLNIPLTSSTLEDIWPNGIKPKWEKMVICLREFLADEFKSKSPSIPNVDVIDIYEEGHDQWLAKIEEAISNEKFGVAQAAAVPHHTRQMLSVAQTRDGENRAGTDRRAAVDAFIEEVFQKTGKRISRTDIWRVTGYRDRTEFERFQRGDRRTTRSAKAAFFRTLKMDPKAFIEFRDKNRTRK